MTDASRAEQIIADWQEANESGSAVDPMDVIRAHPEVASELKVQFRAILLIDEVLSPEGVSGPTTESVERIGDFVIRGELGRGGMGVVYEAEQESMSRPVALKVLASGYTTSDQAVERFRREARAAGRLHHTNIVPVYALGTHGGNWFYAMELVAGRALSAVIDDIRAQTEEAKSKSRSGVRATSVSISELGTATGDRSYHVRVAEMFAGVADALALAHEEGIIHRDIKPGNLLLTADGVLKIVDFGLARLEGPGAAMTAPGSLIGTPRYMSPEQATIKGVAVDPRTDLYSLGATLYEVLTLKPPFDGKNIRDICTKIVSHDPQAPRGIDRRIPKDLETIVLKAMEKDRDGRYQTAADMARDLRQFALGGVIRARPVGPLRRMTRRVRRSPVRTALAAGVVIALAAGVWLYLHFTAVSSAARVARYRHLLAAAADAFAASVAQDLEAEPGDVTHVFHDLYSEAISLQPENPEGYLLRALAPSRDWDARNADIDRSVELGVPPATVELLRAHILALQERWTAARAAASRVGSLPVTSAVGAFCEGRLHTGHARFEQAIRSYTDAIERSAPKSTIRFLATRERARLRLNRGQPEEALRDLVALRELGDDSLAVGIQIATAWHLLGELDRAEAEFAAIMESTGASHDPRRWALLSSAARDFSAPGWHDRITAQALRRFPLDALILKERAQALSLLARQRWDVARYEEADPLYRKALIFAEKALDLSPSKKVAHAAWESKAEILNMLGLKEEALEAARKAYETDPSCKYALQRFGGLLVHTGQPNEAVDHLNAAFERDPQYLMPLIVRSEVEEVIASRSEEGSPEWRKGQERALAWLDRAISIKDGNPLAHFRRAQVLARLDRETDALVAYDAALKINPRFRHGNLHKAQFLGRLERYGEALAAIDAELEIRPDDLHAVHYRGHVYTDLAEPEKALDDFRRAAAGPSEVRHYQHDLPDTPHLLYDVAGTLEKLGRLDEAIAAHRQVLLEDEDYADAWQGLARCQAKAGQLQPALASYSRAIEEFPAVDPEYAEPWINKGALLANELQRYDDALVLFKKAIEIDGNHPMAWMNKGAVLARLGRLEQALPALDRAIELDPGVAKSFFLRGGLNRDLGHVDAALVDFTRAIQLAPEMSGAWTDRGALQKGFGRYDKALADFAQALDLDPDLQPALYGMASVLALAGRAELALPVIEKAIRLSPEEAANYRERGDILRDLRRDVEAVASYEKGIELDPTAENIASLADFYNQRWRLKKALHVARRAVSTDPDDADALTSLGMILNNLAGELSPQDPVREERFHEALKVLQRAIDRDPRKGSAYAFTASAYERLGDHEKAIEFGRRGTEVAPGSRPAWFHYASALQKAGRLEEAEAAYRRVTQLAPKDTGALNNLGLILRSRNKPGEAREVFLRVLTLQPGMKEAMLNAAGSLWQMGELEPALAELKETLAVAPDWPLAWNATGDLLLDMHRAAEAVEHFGRMHEKWPGRSDAFLGLVNALNEDGRVDDALAKLDAKLAEYPRWRGGWKRKGEILLHADRIREALVHHEKTLEHWPGDFDALAEKAVALQHLGRLAEGVEIAKALIRARPGEWRGYGLLIGLLNESGRRDELIPACDETLTRFPRHLWVLQQKASTLRALGKIDAAKEVARHLLDQGYRADRFMEFAFAHALLGEKGRAREILAGFGLSPYGMYNRARVHVLLGERDEAMDWLAKAAEGEGGIRWPLKSRMDPEILELADHPRYAEVVKTAHKDYSK